MLGLVLKACTDWPCQNFDIVCSKFSIDISHFASHEYLNLQHLFTLLRCTTHQVFDDFDLSTQCLHTCTVSCLLLHMLHVLYFCCLICSTLVLERRCLVHVHFKIKIKSDIQPFQLQNLVQVFRLCICFLLPSACSGNKFLELYFTTPQEVVINQVIRVVSQRLKAGVKTHGLV